MVSFHKPLTEHAPPRLARLQKVQEENYRQLQLLIPEQISVHDTFRSKLPSSPLLRMHILERHAYTLFIRMSYDFEGGAEPRFTPDAHIRLYEDARLAEVTAFDPGQGFRRSAHPWYPPSSLMARSWRENRALDKWLSYLLNQGHSVDTMQLARRGIEASEPALEPATVA